MARGHWIRKERQERPDHTLERIVRNYIETNRTIRQLADYYDVPKSTIHDWINKEGRDRLPYSLFDSYKRTAKEHMDTVYRGERVCSYDGDGSLD